MDNDDYYKVLGVERGSANEDDIKRAYKKLALKLHPDRGGDAELFKKVSEAYSVLSDPQKKSIYDLHGKEALNGFEQAENNTPFPFGGAAGGMPPFDMFHNFFGGGMPPRGGPHHHRGRRIKEVDLALTLEEIYQGKAKTVDVTRRVIDQKEVKGCEACQGQGVHVRIQGLPGMGIHMFQQQVTPCDACHGVGKIVPDNSVDIVNEQITIDIPKGCAENTRIVAQGKIDDIPGGEPGDLVFRVTYKDHPHFKVINGSDLETTIRINLLEALQGFTRIVKHLDGSFLTITSSRVVRPGSRWCLSGEGLSDAGNLFCIIDIEFPDKINGGKGSLTALLNQKRLVQRVSSPDAVVRKRELENEVIPEKPKDAPPPTHTEEGAPECVQQ